MKVLSTVLLGSICLFSGCVERNDDMIGCDFTTIETCPQTVLVGSENDFESTPFGSVDIKRVEFNDNFVTLVISVNSCLEPRTYKLHVSPSIQKSNPPQRDAKLIFEHHNCEQQINEQICIDRSNLRGETILNLKTWTGTIPIHLPALD